MLYRLSDKRTEENKRLKQKSALYQLKNKTKLIRVGYPIALHVSKAESNCLEVKARINHHLNNLSALSFGVNTCTVPP